jgi:hypothetical protein
LNSRPWPDHPTVPEINTHAQSDTQVSQVYGILNNLIEQFNGLMATAGGIEKQIQWILAHLQNLKPYDGVRDAGYVSNAVLKNWPNAEFILGATISSTHYNLIDVHIDAATPSVTFAAATGLVYLLGKELWFDASKNVGIGENGSSQLVLVGSGGVTTASQITSTLADGTAPFVVTSKTMVANLNAERWGGETIPAGGSAGYLLASDGTHFVWKDPGSTSAETDPVFVASPAYGITQDEIDAWNGMVDGWVPYTGATDDLDLGLNSLIANTLESTAATGAPMTVASDEMVANLNAEFWGDQALPALVDGYVLSNSSGVLEWVTGFVPYTGADSDVDLGDYSLTADTLKVTGLATGVTTQELLRLVNGSGLIDTTTGLQYIAGSPSKLQTSGQFKSTVTSYPPLEVTSSTLVTNLNADKWDGWHMPTPVAGKFLHYGTALEWEDVDTILPTHTGYPALLASDGVDAYWTAVGSLYFRNGTLGIGTQTGTAPIVVSSTTLCPNLHAAVADLAALATVATTATNATNATNATQWAGHVCPTFVEGQYLKASGGAFAWGMPAGGSGLPASPVATYFVRENAAGNAAEWSRALPDPVQVGEGSGWGKIYLGSIERSGEGVIPVTGGMTISKSLDVGGSAGSATTLTVYGTGGVDCYYNMRVRGGVIYLG